MTIATDRTGAGASGETVKPAVEEARYEVAS